LHGGTEETQEKLSTANVLTTYLNQAPPEDNLEVLPSKPPCSAIKPQIKNKLVYQPNTNQELHTLTKTKVPTNAVTLNAM
jgi:hypothetical protein